MKLGEIFLSLGVNNQELLYSKRNCVIWSQNDVIFFLFGAMKLLKQNIKFLLLLSLPFSIFKYVLCYSY